MRQSDSRNRPQPRRVVTTLRGSPPEAQPPAHAPVATRILVIEDDDGARDALVLLLGHLGYAVSSASNGAEALQQVTDITPDLVVTDWRMPGISGLALCLALRERRSTMPIVVVTSADEVFTSDQPVDARLRKPIDPAVLDRVIVEALRFAGARENAYPATPI